MMEMKSFPILHDSFSKYDIQRQYHALLKGITAVKISKYLYF